MARSLAPAVVTASALVLMAMAPSVDGHMFQMLPVCRQYHRTPIFQNWDFDPEKMEHCPSCYNGQGPDEIIKRAKKDTDPEALAAYGGGDQWPLYVAFNKGEKASNGNYLEPQAISARHGACGDPGQVTGALFACTLL